MSTINIQQFIHIVASNEVCDSIFRYALIHVILMLFHSCIVEIHQRTPISHLQQIQKKETHTSLQFTQNNTTLPTSPNFVTLTSNIFCKEMSKLKPYIYHTQTTKQHSPNKHPQLLLIHIFNIYHFKLWILPPISWSWFPLAK